MPIKHIEKTSLIDYPGHISTILFVGYCNFRCGFCYNTQLVLTPNKFKNYILNDIITLLLKRKTYIDHIVITGGEPTIQYDIFELLDALHSNGFKIKLDTNGYRPATIKSALNLIDYIAMDIKGPLESYSKIIQCTIDPDLIVQSIKLIRESGIKHEFRTTIWYDNDIFPVLFSQLPSLIVDSPYYIQNYYSPVACSSYMSLSKGQLDTYLAQLKNINVKTRGVFI